jgi:exopolysaccharide production protein ExoQ
MGAAPWMDPPQAPAADGVLSWPGLLALAWLVPAAAVAGVVLFVLPVADLRLALLLPVAVLVPGLALWVLARAAGRAGRGGALALLAAVVVFVSDIGLRSTDTQGLDAQSVIKLAAWSSGLALLAVCWRELWAALAHAPSAGLGLLGLWCLVGAITSATPLYTAAAASALLGVWALAVLCARRLDGARMLWALVLALSALMLLSLLLGWLLPAWALTPMENGRWMRLSGAFASPNNLGRAAALLVLLVVLLAPRLRAGVACLLLATALPLGAACLLLSESRTSMLALALALGVAWLTHRRGWALGVAAAVLTLMLVLLLTPGSHGWLVQAVSRSGSVEELSSFTGRTDIWQAVLALIAERPLIGHGYASSREVLPAGFQGAWGWTTSSAHNLWLQAWLTTGLVGLVIVLAAQAAWLWQALWRPHALRDAVVVFVCVVGLAEASALGPSVNLMTFVWCWAMALAPGLQGAPRGRDG